MTIGKKDKTYINKFVKNKLMIISWAREKCI